MRTTVGAVGRAGVAVMLTCFAVQTCWAGMNLPDPLKCSDGTMVTTTSQWESKRRPETLQLFKDHVYGRQTVGRPKNMSFHVVKKDTGAMGGAATLKIVEIRIQNDAKTDGLTIKAIIFIPNKVAKPAPGFLLINHRSESIMDPTRERKSDYWPAEEMIARGYMASVFHVSNVDPDSNYFNNGVHKVFDGSKRLDDTSWGALAAWAWGASRIMDYFETDTDIDHKHIAVVGHSRTGKAALVTGAYDQRFYLPISNNSGEGGAALARHRSGESLESVSNGFPYWFNSVYRTYGKNIDGMPTDQHQLIALIAPRPVYVASGSEDSWADPVGEFLSLVNARSVYALYGYAGIADATFPAQVNTQIKGDRMGYHLREGGHGLRKYDWLRFMDYFDFLRKNSNPPASASSLAAKPIQEDRSLSTSSAVLNWKDNATDETGFRIERKKGSSGTWVEVHATLTPNEATYTDIGLERGATYYYRVCAYNTAGKSAWTPEAQAAIPSQIYRQPDNPKGATQGVSYTYYAINGLKKLPDFEANTAQASGTLDDITLSIPNRRSDDFAVRYRTFLKVPADGNYTFHLKSDDGSRLHIGSTLVIDNDGAHAPREVSGSIGLKAGLHAITLDYFEDYSGETLVLSWESAKMARQRVPRENLYRVTLREPENPQEVLSGVTYDYYEGQWNNVPSFAMLNPAEQGVLDNITLDIPDRDTDLFGVSFHGYLDVPVDGFYSLHTYSDDGSRLYVGDTLVVANDGAHSARERSGVVGLKAGKHAITVQYCELYGQEVLEVAWSRPGVSREVIPTSRLYRDKYSQITPGYYILLAKHTQQALDVEKRLHDNGVAVIQYPRHDQYNQQWSIEAVAGSNYRMVARHSGKVAETAISKSNGTLVQQWSWNGGSNQQWRFELQDNGYHKVSNAYSGLALDVYKASTESAAPVQVWTWYGNVNQHWKLVRLGNAGATCDVQSGTVWLSDVDDDTTVTVADDLGETVSVQIGPLVDLTGLSAGTYTFLKGPIVVGSAVVE